MAGSQNSDLAEDDDCRACGKERTGTVHHIINIIMMIAYALEAPLDVKAEGILLFPYW